MKKKLLTLFLAICMICTLLPFSAFAANDYEIIVGGINVTDANKNDVMGNGTVKYDSSTGTLTLNNANITSSYGVTVDELGESIYAGVLIGEGAGDVNIVLKGDNKISTVCSMNGAECLAIAMVSSNKLSFSGSGSLTVTAKGMSSKAPSSCAAIFAFNIDIKGGTINVASGDAEGAGSLSAGIICYDTLNISGGTVKATAGKAAESIAVFVGGAPSPEELNPEELVPGTFNMTGGKLTAVCEKSNNESTCGVFFYGSSFKVSGGTLVAQGDMAILAGDDKSPVVYKCPEGGKVYAGADSNAKAWDGKTTFDNFKYVKIDFDKNPFVDVAKGSYCYDSVLWAVGKGITNGIDATHFAPNNNCTRGQIVTFLWRANGCPDVKGIKNPFVDVAKGSYCYEAVLWAVDNGITKGFDATHFKPGESCTRGQVVTFLWRAEGYPEPASTKCPFNDVKTGAFYYNAMLWAVGEGITKGTDATHFAPNQTCTRGQIVTFLYRDLK